MPWETPRVLPASDLPTGSQREQNTNLVFLIEILWKNMVIYLGHYEIKRPGKLWRVFKMKEDFKNTTSKKVLPPWL